MKNKLLFLPLLLACLWAPSAPAQNVRFDLPWPSISSQYSTPFLVANTPSTGSPVLSVCAHPANQVPCTNYITTYTQSGSVCPNGSQDTPQPQPSACQSTGDAQGNVGFWVAPTSADTQGRIDITVCVNNNCGNSPYTLTLSALTANAVRSADYLPGADCGAKINACLSGSLASGGLAGLPGTCKVSTVCGTSFTTSVNANNNWQLIDFEPGTFTLSAVIAVSGVGAAIRGPSCTASIDGNGETCPTVFKEAIGANLPALITLSGGAEVVENLTLDGNCNWFTIPTASCTNNPTEGDGLLVTGLRASMFRIHAWRFRQNGVHVRSTGLVNQAASAQMAWSMTVANGADGLLVEDTGDMFATGGINQFENNGTSGVEINGGGGGRFIGNDFGGNGQITPVGAFYCHGAGASISYQPCISNIVEGNQFGSNFGPDIFVKGFGDNGVNYGAFGNQFVGNFHIGSASTANTVKAIDLQDTKYNLVAAEQFVNAGNGNAYSVGVGSIVNGGHTSSTNYLSSLFFNSASFGTNAYSVVAGVDSVQGSLTEGGIAQSTDLQLSGILVQPGVTFANLPGSPALGTQQFCTNCVATTAATCSTNTPASCVCIAGTGSMWAKRENFMNNGANWYCH